jgi:hypothetical protein
MPFSALLFSFDALVWGVALTIMASNLIGLALARRTVRWAPEPLLQAGLLVLVVVFVGLNQWDDPGPAANAFYAHWRYRQFDLFVPKLVMLYVAVTACWPDVGEAEGEIDLYAHYDDSRRLSFGALAAELAFYEIYYWAVEQSNFRWGWEMLGCVAYMAACVAMIFLRPRWLHKLLLTAGILFFGSAVAQCGATVSAILSTVFHRH